jgi:hypothetical protein
MELVGITKKCPQCERDLAMELFHEGWLAAALEYLGEQ